MKSTFKAILFASFLFFYSCSYLKVFYAPDHESWNEFKLADSFNIISLKDTSLCIIGDTGEIGDQQSIDILYKAINSDDCDNIVVLGDLIYPHGLPPVNPSTADKFQACLEHKQSKNKNMCLHKLAKSEEYKKWEESLFGENSSFNKRFLNMHKYLESKKNIFLLMGNHDYAHNSSLDSARRSMMNWLMIHHFSKIIPGQISKLKNIHFPKNFYSLKLGDSLCMAVSDTETIYQGTYHNDKKGIQYDIQKKWIKNVKNNFSEMNCQFKILLAHQPYLSSGSRHGQNKDILLNTFNRLSPVLKQFYEDHVLGEFDIIISGHDHHISNEGEILLNGNPTKTFQYISGSGGHKISEIYPRNDIHKHQGKIIWPKDSKSYYGHIKIFQEKDKLISTFNTVHKTNSESKPRCRYIKPGYICESYQFGIEH